MEVNNCKMYTDNLTKNIKITILNMVKCSILGYVSLKKYKVTKLIYFHFY